MNFGSCIEPILLQYKLLTKNYILKLHYHQSQPKCVQSFTIAKQRCAFILPCVFLSVAHLLEVTDPVQPSGSHVSREAVSRLSSEDRHGASFRPIHP